MVQEPDHVRRPFKDITSSRGLKWHKLSARQTGVDIFAPADPPTQTDDLERRMDSPTGVSFYVTRACIDRIGLMDNSYWLYWEDFDWGVRAKAACGVGYAHNSIVPHIGGSSSGASGKRARRSVAFVYLVNRNKLRFVRQHHRGWFAWTVFVSFLRTGEYTGGRIDAQLRRGDQGSCRRTARREGSARRWLPTQASV